MLAFVSLPCLINKLNCPLPESTFAISNLTLSPDPLTNDPLVEVLPELFIIAPCDKVSKVNEAVVKSPEPVPIAAITPVEGKNVPDTILVRSTVSPPCWK